MKSKVRAGFCSCENSLLNKLLDTSEKERKKVIPVCAVDRGLNFVAINAKSVHCWITQCLTQT